MGLTADIYDIFGFTNHVISEAAALQASITDVTMAVNHFAALLDNQSGATVVSMRNYITGFASSIQAIADAVNMAFMQILMVYQGAYAKIDSDAYAVINEDTISEVLNAYRNSYLWMDDELDIVKEMYYRVCGFTDVTMPCFENAFTRIEEFEAKEKKYRQKLLDTEACFDANELVLLQNLTESSLTYLTGLMPQGYNAATWAHGFVAGANNTASLQFTDNPELYNSILSVVVYTTENTNVINDLSEISRANCERYIIDKRWEEGWKKLSTGAFAMMSGAGALGVALGKAGVLLKVLGFVTGPTAAIFGGAEAAEGLQDIYISVDELDKEAVNKIKARLGEDAYYKILYGSTIASDLVCLAGLVSELNAVPGSLDDLPSGRPGKAPEMGGESGSTTVIYGSDDIANYQYNMIENPGPLAEMPNQPAKNFYGGRYNMEVLQEDRIMYRAGNAQNPYGRWFTSEPPASVTNVRIDAAVKTHWIDPKTGAYEASSYIDNVYAIKVPKGTTIYTGSVGPQGGVYVGGYNVMQTYIDAPWTFEVVGKTPLQ